MMQRATNGTPPPRQHSEVSASAFTLNVVKAGRMAMVRMEGPLDLQSAGGFLEQVQPLRGTGRRLVLDLRQVPYVDSSGVRALLTLSDEVESDAGELRLVLSSESRIERVLGLLQLTNRFRIYRNASDAWVPREAA